MQGIKHNVTNEVQLPPRLPGSTQKLGYLAKLSSEPGARGATAEAESENTSTSSPPPEEGGGPVGAGGTAPRPSRSADGEGVDWKRRKGSVSMDSRVPKPHRALCLLQGQVLGAERGNPETAESKCELRITCLQSKPAPESR